MARRDSARGRSGSAVCGPCLDRDGIPQTDIPATCRIKDSHGLVPAQLLSTSPTDEELRQLIRKAIGELALSGTATAKGGAGVFGASSVVVADDEDGADSGSASSGEE
jgi:hypothetical protein